MSRTHTARSEPSLEAAILLAVEAHCGQVYPAPEPERYILHPLRVMLGVTSRVAQIVAVLHDVVEDSDTTLNTLAEQGFSEDILDALDCITHRPGEAYEDYVDRLSVNPIAREVKLSDLRDNLANNRALPSPQRTLLGSRGTNAHCEPWLSPGPPTSSDWLGLAGSCRPAGVDLLPPACLQPRMRCARAPARRAAPDRYFRSSHGTP